MQTLRLVCMRYECYVPILETSNLTNSIESSAFKLNCLICANKIHTSTKFLHFRFHICWIMHFYGICCRIFVIVRQLRPDTSVTSKPMSYLSVTCIIILLCTSQNFSHFTRYIICMVSYLRIQLCFTINILKWQDQTMKQRLGTQNLDSKTEQSITR